MIKFSSSIPLHYLQTGLVHFPTKNPLWIRDDSFYQWHLWKTCTSDPLPFYHTYGNSWYLNQIKAIDFHYTTNLAPFTKENK